MSLYTELGIATHQIAYSVLQQPKANVDAEEYRTLLDKWHAKIREETATLREAFQTSLLDTRMKFAQVAMGSLNQYLSTPIKSDNEDVQRIIKDAFEKYSEQILLSPKVGIEATWGSQVIAGSLLVSSQSKISRVVRKMLSAGKKSLKDLGFKTGKAAPNLFESVYMVEGSTNLDALEYLLAKNQISDSQLMDAVNNWSSLYNVMLSVGESKQSKNLGDPSSTSRVVDLREWEANLHPLATGVGDVDFMSELASVFERLSKEFNLHQLSLWQRKFATENSGKFIVRVRMIPDQKLLLEVIKWLSSLEKESVKKSLTETAALVVKEIIS